LWTEQKLSDYLDYNNKISGFAKTKIRKRNFIEQIMTHALFYTTTHPKMLSFHQNTKICIIKDNHFLYFNIL
jgi:hypothetical protein